MKLLAFDPAKKKQVLCGEIAGTSLFRWVKPEHFMRVLQGYGIQEVAFQKICEEELKMIILKEEHTGLNWEAPVEIWKLHGKVMDYGHGKQRFLSLKYMKTHQLPKPDEQKERKREKTIQESIF